MADQVGGEGCADDADGDTHPTVLEADEALDFLVSADGTTTMALRTVLVEEKTTCLLFFSASWCRPCRNFLPALIDLYNTINASEDKKLEIIFVSFDRDQTSFLQHWDQMPWPAAPFDVNVRTRLCDKYDIERIPSLIPLTSSDAADGDREDAVKLVEDYGAQAFPFGAKRRAELEAIDRSKRLGGKLEELLIGSGSGRDYLITRDHGAKPILVGDLVGKTIGLYFGAHWCPPCRSFTSKLVEAYKELKSPNYSFEIVFISTERDESEFNSSLEEMPWLAIPYSDKSRRQDLSRIFGVKGIPTLVVLGPDGKAVSSDGRAMISSHGARAFPFTESRAAEVKADLKEEGERLPQHVKDPRHEHALKLDTAEAYVCDRCGLHGRNWVFSCDLCDFDLHPACCCSMSGSTVTKILN